MFKIWKYNAEYWTRKWCHTWCSWVLQRAKCTLSALNVKKNQPSSTMTLHIEPQLLDKHVTMWLPVLPGRAGTSRTQRRGRSRRTKGSLGSPRRCWSSWTKRGEGELHFCQFGFYNHNTGVPQAGYPICLNWMYQFIRQIKRNKETLYFVSSVACVISDYSSAGLNEENSFCDRSLLNGERFFSFFLPAWSIRWIQFLRFFIKPNTESAVVENT